MVGRMRLGQISLRLQAIFGNTLPFGGVDVVLVGDTGQLPPVFDTPKFDESYKKKGPIPPTVVEGLKVYKMFSTVVQLKRSFRQDSSDVFYSTLQRMRQGTQTTADWRYFCTRNLEKLPSDERALFLSNTTVRFCSTRQAAADWNAIKLKELRKPLVVLKARHTGVGGAGRSADDFGGLEARTVLAEGARVSLTKNLWTDKGLFNGSLGTVVAFLYAEGEHPDDGDLPETVVVNFDAYLGPGLEGNPGHVAVPVSTQGFAPGGGSKGWVERSQVPLVLCWATTIHKSQGQTVGEGQANTRMVLDIGEGPKAEFSPGLSFVGFSRAKTVTALALSPMPNLDRFKKVGQGLAAAARRAHEAQQTTDAASTRAQYQHLLTNQWLAGTW